MADSGSTGIDPASHPPHSQPRKPQIPDHELLECIGRGSYGTVWLARNVMGSYRAVKVVYRETFNDQRPYEREFAGIKRFEPISRSHENLVDVLQVGRNDEEGYFYYVMELCDDLRHGAEIVPGQYEAKTLGREVAHRQRLPFAECLDLSVALARGLGHLHSRGLIHRDIKPSNLIFVNGIPKIADIGLVAEEGSSKSFVGTEGYIPPEGPGTVQADIYSLGKVLYEISSGKDRQTYPELPTALDEDARLTGFLELNEVIIRACDSDVRKRYRTTDDVLSDLQLLQAGRSVKRLRVLERRMSLAFRGGMILAALAVIVLVAYYQSHREEMLVRQNLARSYGVYGTRSMDEGDIFAGLPYFAEALRLEQGDEERARRHRMQLAVLFQETPRLTGLFSLPGDPTINDVQFSPDGDRLIVVGAGGLAEVHRADLSGILLRLEGHNTNWAVGGGCYSPDGRWIATAGRDGVASIWDAQTGERLMNFDHGNSVNCIRFNPDGSKLVTGTENGRLWVWPAQNNAVPISVEAHEPNPGVSYASYNSDGNRIATCSYDETAKVWDAETLELTAAPLQTSHSSFEVSFSPDDAYLLTASYLRGSIWDAVNLADKPVVELRPASPMRRAQFSPDGLLIAGACWDYGFNVRIWDVAKRKEAFPPLKHLGYPMAATFSPAGHSLVTATANGVLSRWELAVPTPTASRESKFYSGNGTYYASLQSNVVSVWNSINGTRAADDTRCSFPVKDVRVADDGSYLVAIGPQEETTNNTTFLAQHWDLRTGAPGPLLKHDPTLRTAEISPSGRFLVSMNDTNGQVWDLQSGERYGPPLPHSAEIGGATVQSKDLRLVTRAGEQAYLWDLSTLTNTAVAKPLSTFKDVRGLKFVGFSPDGRYYITCCTQGDLKARAARLFDAMTGDSVCEPLWHHDGVSAASFSPDSKRVVTASDDRSAIVWAVPSGRQLTSPMVHAHQVMDASFSQDGSMIVTVDFSSRVRVWDSLTGVPITPSWPSSLYLWHVQFVAGDRRVVAHTSERHGWVQWSTKDPAETQPVARESWSLPIDPRPLEHLVQHGRLLAGWKLGEASEPLILHQNTLFEYWTTLRELYPEAFQVTTADIVHWHERYLARSEKESSPNPLAARFHREQLARLGIEVDLPHNETD